MEEAQSINYDTNRPKVDEQTPNQVGRNVITPMNLTINREDDWWEFTCINPITRF